MKIVTKLIGLLIILVGLTITSGCGREIETPTSLPEPTETGVPTATITLTPVPATVTPSPVPPSATPAAESPPPGTFGLIWYEPLVLTYDVDQWEDMTEYNHPQPLMNNYLQSKTLPSCTIGVQGPTEFSDPSAYHAGRITVGEITYETKLFTDTSTERFTTFYIDLESLGSAFDYSNWLPVLVVQVNFDDYNACRALAEAVLATLHVP